MDIFYEIQQIADRYALHGQVEASGILDELRALGSLGLPQRIAFDVTGQVKAQPRQRSVAIRGKGGKPVTDKEGRPIIRPYDPGTAEGWKADIATAVRGRLPDRMIEGPVQAFMEFRFQRPKSHFGTGRNAAVLKPSSPEEHLKKPDQDNLNKAVTDVLTNLQFYRDDSQVVLGASAKRWCLPGEREGAEVVLRYRSER